MKSFLRIQSEIFGLDINDSSIKIIKLKEKKGRRFLVSYNDLDLEKGIVENGIIKNEEALSKAIKKLCETANGQKLDTKHVCVSLPEEKSFLQVIQMPNLPEKELKSAALFEVENYIPLPMEEIYVDFQKICSTDGRAQVLLAAMPRQVVDSYVSCVEKAGLILSSMETESQATARAVVDKAMSQETVVLVDIGRDNTSFIIYSCGAVRFTTSIAVVAFPESEEKIKELAGQIIKYIDFYLEHFFHEAPNSSGAISKILLCGGGSSSEKLPKILAEELKLPVETAFPFKDIIMPKRAPVKNPLSFTTALGLAERGLIEGREYPSL